MIFPTHTSPTEAARIRAAFEDYKARVTAPRPQPARVVAVTELVLAVLQDLTTRPPESLSDAEADFWGCLIETYDDLQRIRDRARDEMGAAAVSILREGAV